MKEKQAMAAAVRKILDSYSKQIVEQAKINLLKEIKPTKEISDEVVELLIIECQRLYKLVKDTLAK